ncbi:MAG: DUF1573 domain-containing protein [Bacteroidia bacterium]|jgi:hypothetical protein|nr:DUF1573 domain-containing protein [Bacteroidia bacterium]
MQLRKVFLILLLSNSLISYAQSDTLILDFSQSGGFSTNEYQEIIYVPARPIEREMITLNLNTLSEVQQFEVGKTYTVNIGVFNPSDNAGILAYVNTGCFCETVTWDQNTVNPKATRNISIAVRPMHSGNFESIATVYINSADNRFPIAINRFRLLYQVMN